MNTPHISFGYSHVLVVGMHWWIPYSSDLKTYCKCGVLYTVLVGLRGRKNEGVAFRKFLSEMNSAIKLTLTVQVLPRPLK